MTTNIQSFAGDVQIDNGNLTVKSLEVKDGVTKLASNNTAYSNVGVMMTRKDGASNVAFLFTEDGANVVLGYTNDEAFQDDRIDILTDATANLVVYGNVYVSGSVHGDGSTLTGLVTTLQSVSEFGAETDRTILFTNETTGINVSSNVLVSGNVTANVYFGDGGLLSNITQTLEGITAIGNTTPYTIEFKNTDTSLVTLANVGIANTNPTADLCVGSNLVVDDSARDVLQVTGNVNCHGLYLQSISILPGYGLDTVTDISNTTPNTISITHESISLVTTSMAGIGITPLASDVGTSGLHVDGHIRLGGPANNTDEEQMYIKSAGALDIIANESNTNNDNTRLKLQAGLSNNASITMFGDDTDATRQYMTFATRGTEAMRIENSNVGIGTATPRYALDVYGDINFTGDFYESGSPFISTPWTITGDDIYYTKAGGHVGVGTASTGAKFHTEGNVYISSYDSDSTSNGGVVINGGLAVSSNIHTGNLYVSDVYVETSPDLDSVCAVAASTTRAVSITNTTESYTNDSGALTIDGGLGVAGNIHCSNLYTSNALIVSNLYVGNVYASNLVIDDVFVDVTPDFQAVTTSGNSTTRSFFTTSTEPSVSPTTGAIQVAGGVGVQGNVYVGTQLDVSGNVQVGTANLFVDTTTGYVGVGTTTPGMALEVYSATGTQLKLSSSSRYSTIYGVDDTGSCFFGNDRGDFRITTGGNTSGTGASEALRIDSSGYIKQNLMPRFSAYYPDDADYDDLSAYSVIKMSATIFNVGSGYDTSTGYFTAPIDGYYAFHMQLYSSTSSASKRFEIYFKENSSSTAVTYNLHQHAAGNASGGQNLNLTTYAYNGICNIAIFSFITKMAAGNQIAPVTSTSIRTYLYRNVISGHMISAA